MHLHTVVALGEVDPIMFVVLFRFMIHVLENAGVPAVHQFSVLQRLRWNLSDCIVLGKNGCCPKNSKTAVFGTASVFAL